MKVFWRGGRPTVNIVVIKKFISRIQERAQGTKVVKSIKPGELFIKIIRDELINLFGETAAPLEYSNKKPSIFLITGLQGSGKTTTCAKLAKKINNEGKSVSLIAADIYRTGNLTAFQHRFPVVRII